MLQKKLNNDKNNDFPAALKSQSKNKPYNFFFFF